MCGICGIVGRADTDVVAAMSATMAHRGPDDDGLYVDRERQVVLGHRRLSIIDVGNGGHQPMSFADGRYWIVFNGEIYNYMELRSQLEKLGHNFASQSDTEVLLASYAEWGEHCLLYTSPSPRDS